MQPAQREQTLLVIRHAERGQLATSDDPGLSARGQLQAKAFVEWYRRQGLKAPHPICASPRLRAQETLRPLAADWKSEVIVRNDLNERAVSESESQFDGRVRKLASHLDQSDLASPIVLCSHLDWLNSFRVLFNSDLSESQQIQPWSPGEVWRFRRREKSDLWSFVEKAEL